MTTKRTGRPRGRPQGTTKAFSADPDRYVIGMVNGLRLYGAADPLEYLIHYAVYFHHGSHRIFPKPLENSNRVPFELTEKMRAAIRAGDTLVSVEGDGSLIESNIERIKKKIRRISAREDADIRKWMYYSSLAWVLMLKGNPGAALTCWKQIGELEYLEKVLLPRINKYFGQSGLSPI